MSRPPDVSILLPFYQAAETIGLALESIRRQSLRQWQCVLVDDGSSDAGAELAARTAAADARFLLLRRPHEGLVGSLNAGLDHCSAPLVARMDADDVMHRQRLAAQVAALDSDPGLAGVGCHVRVFPRRSMTAGLRDYEAWLNQIGDAASLCRNAFVESPLVHPSLLLRRDVLGRFRYRDAGWPEDYDLLLRLLGAGLELAAVPRRLLLWRDSAHRLTRTAAPYALERITACKAFFLADSLLRDHQRYILWGYGSTGRSLRRALSAHGKAMAYLIEMHPGRLGQRLDGAPVVPPEEISALPRLPLIASVAGAGPRAQIRAFLSGRSFVEGTDFVCAA